MTTSPESDKPKNKRQPSQKITDRKASVIAIEAHILFGNGRVKQPGNVNERNMAFIQTIQEMGAKVLIVPPQDADAPACFDLKQKVKSNYMVRHDEDMLATEFIATVLHITQSKKEQLLYISNDPDRIADLAAHQIKAMHMGVIQPDLLVSDRLEDIDVRMSQARLNVLQERIWNHLSLKQPAV